MERFAGRYLLLRPLGHGGMGDVHLARDLASGSECALKRISANAPDIAPELLRNEYELLARVRHPAVVEVHDLGVAADGTAYITMDYVPGLPADRVLHPGDWSSIAFVAAQVAAGLQAIHAAGVIHGDLKPSNLLVTPGATEADLPVNVRLVDFGLAGLLGGETEGHRGTPGFAAPEVVAGAPPSVASDLYGLGATLYQLISGRVPFADEKSGTQLRKQQTMPPPALPLEETGCPAPLVQLVLRLMAVEPAERPGDAREVRIELERAHPAARRPLAERLDTTIVVGRERELAQLERRLTEASRRTRMVILAGEPGSGKTTLVSELATRAALAGNRVVRCSGGASVEQGHAALVLLRAISGVASGVDTTRESPRTSLLDPARTAMAPDEAIEFVAVAIERLTLLSTESRAPLLLIDDAEDLDPLSRNAIRRVMLSPDAPSALWVLARRGDAGSLSDDDQLLKAAGHAEVIPVAGLDAEGVANLLAARLGELPPEGLAETIWSRTAGHPGLTVEALRGAAETGAITESDLGFAVDREKLDALRLPVSFEQSRLERLAALPESAQHLAEFLSIIGRSITVENIPGDAVDDPEEAVSALAASGLGAHHDGRIALQPPALADAILAQATTERAADLHRAALNMRGLGARERFEHMRALGDVEGATTAAEDAFQSSRDPELARAVAEMIRTTDPIAAARWFDSAADVLLERGKLAEAAPLLDAALELDSESDARFERWIKAADAWARVGENAKAEKLVALGLQAEVPPAQRVFLLSVESTRLRLSGERASALRLARSAASHDGSQAPDAMGAAELALCGALIAASDYRGAVEHGERAAEAFKNADRHDLAVGAISNVAIATLALGEKQRAVALAQEGLRLARASSNRHALARHLSLTGGVLTAVGDLGAGRIAHMESLQIATEEGLNRDVVLALANVAQSDGLTGRPRSARAKARAGIRLAMTHAPVLAPASARALAQAYRVTGRIRAAERTARLALRKLSSGISATEREWVLLELGRCLFANGKKDDAKAVLGRLASLAADATVRPLATALAGHLDLLSGNVASATARLEAQEKGDLDTASPFATAWLRSLRAAISLRQGHTEAGEQSADASLASLSKLPAPWDRALAASLLAASAPRDGSNDASKAVRWLQSAAEGFSRLGDLPQKANCLSQLVSLLATRGDQPSSHTTDRGLIDNVAWLLSSLSEPKELAQRAMKMAVDAMDAERGVLLQIDAESDRLIPIAEYGPLDPSTRQEALGYSRRVVQRVTESGVGMVLGDAISDPALRSESVVNLNLRSIVCVPMHLGGRTIGAVYLDDSRRPEAFSEEDRGMLEGFAQLMAIAIDRSRGHAEVLQTNERLVGENLSLRQEVGVRYQAGNVLGSSSQMRKVLAAVQQAAQVNATAMVTGEMGTGKELIARTLHHTGKRKLRPFVAVNCGAIPENLIASELFGILPNVATDVRARPGRFVEADGGTLFLDEIGEMPPSQQVALLSVLANREVTPVGGGKPISVDVRVICASNRDLREQVEKGDFRPDLFYRLNVIQIDVPPLRDRKADIPMLAHHFLAQFAEEQDRVAPEMSPEFMAALMQSDWKGNVRELQNYIERLLAMNPGPVLYPDPPPRDLEERAGTIHLKGRRPLPEMVEELEKRMVREALERANGNQSRAARDLGITEQSIRYRMKKFGLDTVRTNQRGR